MISVLDFVLGFASAIVIVMFVFCVAFIWDCYLTERSIRDFNARHARAAYHGQGTGVAVPIEIVGRIADEEFGIAGRGIHAEDFHSALYVMLFIFLLDRREHLIDRDEHIVRCRGEVT